MGKNTNMQSGSLSFGEGWGEATIKQFLDKVAANEPVPGGGSVAALTGAIASALTAMVANLTIDKKGYEDRTILMKEFAEEAYKQMENFIPEIDRDSEAYNKVFDCFKLPKNTEEEKQIRSAAIQEATKYAAIIPMEVARRAYQLMKIITDVALKGNKNAVTDACVAMMSARSAVLGALMNVRINLGSIKDKDFVEKFREEADKLERTACEREKQLLDIINKELAL